MNEKNFIEEHYARHAQHFENDLVNEERIRISKSWFDESTADYWRHARAFECAELLNDKPESKWITVGDGRWGLDSIRIRKKGFQSVLPTDISEALLKAAKEQKLIANYAVENAENLSFASGAFDYAFCKESLHHFPRPYAALYEMFRVAKKGVFLIEPNDTFAPEFPAKPSLLQAFPLLGRVLRKLRLAKSIPLAKLPQLRYNPPDWESSGNYVYGISRRDAEKAALGLNMPHLVIKGLNDHYVKGVEFEPADRNRSEIFRELERTINERDTLCRKGLADYNLIMLGFFIQPMDTVTRDRFSANGWTILDLPANPYIPRKSD